MRKNTSLNQKILLIFLGLALISGVSELFLRLHPKFGYRYRSFKFESDKLTLKNMDQMRPSALLGYEQIPSFDSVTNSYGLKSKEYNLKKEKGVYRILILGDSIAAQYWTAEFLERRLNADRNLRKKYRFEIWNAGTASYDIRRYSLYLEHKGLNYKPDMVIIFLFMNDFSLNTNIYYKNEKGMTEYHFPVSEISKVYTPSPFLMRHSYLYRFIILKLDSFLAARKKAQDINLEENGSYYLGRIRRTCQRNNLPLYIAIFPYINPLSAYQDWQTSEYSVISKVVEELKIPHLNLYGLYERLLKESYPLRNMKEDDIHPSEGAQQLISGEIYQGLLNSFFNKDPAS